MQERYVDNLLRSYGCLFYELKGRRIIRTPYAEFPNEHFLEENWNYQEEVGYVRKVSKIKTLKNGENTNIFVKSPEYLFTNDLDDVNKGMIWIRNHAYPHVEVSGHIVEEHIDWEAVFLLELLKNDIKTEVPQAIVEYSGKKKLIVKGIISPTLRGLIEGKIKIKGNENMYDKARELGFCPIDIEENKLLDEEGYTRIIDVNRWSWAPHTDEFYSVLTSLIRERISL